MGGVLLLTKLIILWKVELKFDDHTSILVKFISVTYVGDQVV